MPRQCEQPGGRRHVDQLAALAACHHLRDEALDDVDGAHQVDVDHRLPVLVLQVLHGAPGRDSGDVHDDVHDADLGVDRARECGHPVIVGNVAGLVVEDRAARGTDLGDQRIERLDMQVGDDEVRALVGTGQGGTRPMPLAAPVMSTLRPRSEGTGGAM